MKHSPGFLKLVRATRKHVRERTAERVRKDLKAGNPFVVIDVREDHEWNEARIAGSIHLARGILERDIEALIPDKKQEIVLYCAGGFRSVLAAESLRRLGYTNTVSMRGGWRRWKRIRGPVRKGRA